MFKNIIYCNNLDRVTMYSRGTNLISNIKLWSSLDSSHSLVQPLLVLHSFDCARCINMQQGPAEFDDKSKGSVKCEIHTLFTLKEPLQQLFCQKFDLYQTYPHFPLADVFAVHPSRHTFQIITCPYFYVNC